MKAVLEFNLEEEREEFLNAVNGSRWQLVCFRMDAILRAKIKHAPDDMPDEVIKTLRQLRAELHQTIDANNLDLN